MIPYAAISPKRAQLTSAGKTVIISGAAMKTIAAEVGTWDVFILNAGYLPKPGPIASAGYFRVLGSINVRSIIIAAIAFLPCANKVHATILGVTAAVLVFPPAGTPGLSAYLTLKIAAAKALEYLAAENPSVFVASVHPGMIDTEIFRKSSAKPEMFSALHGIISILNIATLTELAMFASSVARTLHFMALESGLPSCGGNSCGQIGMGRS
ncbi:MAG: hypothetical protein Q9188_001784 [Gyalolechia gomerana]